MRRAALVLCLALAVPASARAAGPGETGRLLVTLRPAAERADSRGGVGRAVAAAAGARTSGFSVPQIRLVTVAPRPGESLRALAGRLRADPPGAAVAPGGRGGGRLPPPHP